MSHALDYREPHRFSAGLLALTVHVAFFALLIVGVRWQSQAPEDFVVELWSTVPTVAVVQEEAPAQSVEPAPVAKVEPPQPAKADIELREKKVKDAEAKEKQRKKDEEIAKAAAAAAKQEAERNELDAYAARRAQAVQANVRAEVAAATAAEVGRYKDMIRSKVKRNIIGNWSGLPESAEAVFKVTLLPDGSVMETELVKSSGSPAYDDAAERAIYKAQPLPLPKDVGLQREFRELRLTMNPKESGE